MLTTAVNSISLNHPGILQKNGDFGMTRKPIEVVAGIIFNQDKTGVLLALRKPDQHQGNCWEFPGGKIEDLENHEQALLRELDEELGIRITACQPYCQIEHDYADKAVRLHFWQVTGFEGEPIGCENQKLNWFALDELADLRFPEANKMVVAKLLGAD